jgi:hypothetical protein
MLAKIIVAALGAVVSATCLAHEFELVITNVTRGQPLTPPLVAVHSPAVTVFELGMVATPGLAELAEDGKKDTLKSELLVKNGVDSVASGSGVIMPGTSATMRIVSSSQMLRFSLVSMLGRTNDTFAGISSIPLPERIGSSATIFALAYDAGSEVNNESCDYIPAPPCNSPGMRDMDDAEGLVTDSAGVQRIGDLDVFRDVFGARVAKVTIKKIH